MKSDEVAMSFVRRLFSEMLQSGQVKLFPIDVSDGPEKCIRNMYQNACATWIIQCEASRAFAEFVKTDDIRAGEKILDDGESND